METQVEDPADRPDFAAGIFRLCHQLKRNGHVHHAISDLMFLKGEPFAILDWGGPVENQFPLIKARLDPSKLEESARKGYYQYCGEPLQPGFASENENPAPIQRRSANG